MEVVSAVASIVTLTALAKELWALSTDLLRNYHNAPKELVRISNQSSLILLELECISRSQDNGHDLTSSLTVEETWIFQQSLNVAKISLTDVYRSCRKYEGGKKRVSARLAWSLFERKMVDECLVGLQRTEMSLCVVLQVINLRASAKARDDNARQNENILEQLKKYHEEIQRSRVSEYATSKLDSVISAFQTRPDSLTSFSFLQSFSIPPSWKSILQTELLLIQSSNHFQNAYELYARLPFFWPWGPKALILSTSLRRTRTYWPNFQILNGSLNFCNIVPVESEIVEACRNGDVLAVREHFSLNKAAPSDVSVDDKGLLWYATESGSTELARFLINAGAPMRSTILHAASYYRRPQIARLLLHSGADIEVIGECGFTPAFFLYGYAGQTKAAQTEFLEILAANSFSNFNGVDHDGWNLVHRVAVYGTAADIKTLVQVKVSLHARTHNLHWIPIFCAVCFGNMETLKELWNQYSDLDLKDITDLRGWNLLHVAAGAGNFDAVPFLLEHGVDLKVISKPTSRFVPPALRNRSVTPSEVAQNCGQDAYVKRTAAIRAAGHETSVATEDIDWTTETIDEIFGGCDCCSEWGFDS